MRGSEGVKTWERVGFRARGGEIARFIRERVYGERQREIKRRAARQRVQGAGERTENCRREQGRGEIPKLLKKGTLVERYQRSGEIPKLLRNEMDTVGVRTKTAVLPEERRRLENLGKCEPS